VTASITDGNYLAASGTATLSITPATAEVTTVDYTGVYDAASHTASVTITGVGGVLLASESLSGTDVADSGSVTASITDGNYLAASGTATLSITSRMITITANAESKTYGDADPTLTYGITSGSLATGDVFTGSLDRTAGENVGIYAINQGSLALDSNYNLTFVGSNLTITKRSVSIGANNATKTFGDVNPVFTAVVSNAAPGDTPNYTLMTTATQFSPVGSYTIVVTLGANPNYNITSTSNASLTIVTRDALARYIGQTIAVASGSSATSAQVALAASVQDPTGNGLVEAKVTFVDTLTNRVLASNIPVSPVPGSPFTGTANTFVTLSTGTYGSQLYNIKVIVTGNYTNEDQLSDLSTAITVTKPAGTESISAAGKIAKSANVAGVYGVQTTGEATFSVDLKYNKSGKNLQGKVELFLPSANGSQIYIKSNALSSMVVDGEKVNGTIYVRANATRLNADGSSTTLDGNISLRIDLSEANSGMVAITAMSSSSQLLYSNDWYFEDTIRGWKSRLQAVSSGFIQIN
jgi:hypothetical protein